MFNINNHQAKANQNHRYHPTPIRIFFKKGNNNSKHVGKWEPSPFKLFVGCKMVQSLWKRVQRFLKFFLKYLKKERIKIFGT